MSEKKPSTYSLPLIEAVKLIFEYYNINASVSLKRLWLDDLKPFEARAIYAAWNEYRFDLRNFGNFPQSAQLVQIIKARMPSSTPEPQKSKEWKPIKCSAEGCENLASFKFSILAHRRAGECKPYCGQHAAEAASK